jgi:hypothetical protein
MPVLTKWGVPDRRLDMRSSLYPLSQDEKQIFWSARSIKARATYSLTAWDELFTSLSELIRESLFLGCFSIYVALDWRVVTAGLSVLYRRLSVVDMICLVKF